LQRVALVEPNNISLEGASISGTSSASSYFVISEADPDACTSSEVSSEICISAKLSTSSEFLLSGSLSSNLMCIDSSPKLVSKLYTMYVF